jgi:TolB protein
VFSSDVGGSEDIYRFVLPDGNPVRLTDGPEKEFDPDLSPDGRLIAYRRNPRAESDAADIWVMRVDGTGKRNLTDAPERMNWAPAWTAAGRIAFARQDAMTGALELWTMAADGSDQRRVAEGWCEYAAPSPDGSAFACAAAVGRNYDIVIVDVRTGGRRAIVRTPQTEFGASWSPDGRWIAFSRDLGDRWALVRIRPDGTDEQEVAREGVFSTWGPDGHLAWSGPGGIDVANADGSGLVVLGYPAGFVAWGP